MKTFFDSPHGDEFIDPIRISVSPKRSFPIREDLTAIIYSIEYATREELFQPSSLGIECPDNPLAFLVSETDPVNDGNGIVKFSRKFATIPSTRFEFETGTFTFPSFKDFTSSTTNSRSTIIRNGVIKVEISYVHTTDPESDINLIEQFTPKDSSGNNCNFISSDSSPTFPEYMTMISTGEYLQIKQSEISRWLGNIWQIKNNLIKAL
jgi:hypothetical protein